VLQVALIYFSAAALATVEFVKHSLPDVDMVEVPKLVIVYAIIVVTVIPSLLLLAADRLIDARDPTGRVLRWFRAAVFAIALLLILRQLQLYWGTGDEITAWLRDTSVVLLVLGGLAAVAGVVALCVWGLKGVTLFFYYMSPVAIALAAIAPFRVDTRGPEPAAGYAQEVSNSSHDASRPAAFVLVLDELAYETLVKDGELDRERYPNFAALADEGLWATNATSNYFWTDDSIPQTILAPIGELSDQFDIRLSSQYPLVENGYVDECGKAYTCRGALYLTEHERPTLTASLALRSFYQLLPETVEPVFSLPLRPFVQAFDITYPTADPNGWHTFTKKQFQLFVDEVDGEEVPGSIYFLHTMVTHWQYVFEEDGDPISSPSRAAALGKDWANPRTVAAYADSLVGKLVDKLKAEGVYENSVFVITADHGLKSYLPSADLPPKQFQVQVPMLIRAPGLSGEVSDVDYQHVDFGATLRELLDVPPADDDIGVSIFEADRPDRDKVFHVNDLTFVQDGKAEPWLLAEH